MGERVGDGIGGDLGPLGSAGNGRLSDGKSRPKVGGTAGKGRPPEATVLGGPEEVVDLMASTDGRLGDAKEIDSCNGVLGLFNEGDCG